MLLRASVPLLPPLPLLPMVRVRLAVKLLAEMADVCLKRDTVNCNAASSACEKASKCLSVMELLAEMACGCGEQEPPLNSIANSVCAKGSEC